MKVWVRRNWLFLPIIGIALFMLLKGLGAFFPSAVETVSSFNLGNIGPGFAEWFTASEVGRWLKWDTESVQRWLWIPGMTVAIIVIMSVMPSKTWGGISQFVTLLITTICIFAITIIITTGKTPEKLITDGFSEKKLNTECADETFMKERVGTEWKKMVVCKNGGVFHVIPKWGYRLEFRISPEFMRENESLIGSRTPTDFITVKNPKTYPGSLAETYLVIPVTRSVLGSVPAFDQIGDNVVFHVRSVK